jgi:UDP-N-acetylmuramoyl-tripeptide--D-alanyl-D-alanine ligase
MTIEQLYTIYLQHPTIQTDTRKLRPGDLFFALKGPNFNGNQFATHALELGAAFVVIDEAPPSTSDSPPQPAASSPNPASSPAAGVPPATSSPVAGSPDADRLLLVPDVLQTLQQLALHHRQRFNIPFLAITGSNGKTTTKELIHAVLSSTFKTYTTQGNLNNHIGIPLTLLSVRPDAQLAVIEMGANHQKEIEGYCRYTLPTHGIITNVGKAHLEGFGGPEGVKKGKGELFDFLRSTNGTAFVMWDYDYLREMSQGIPHLIKYGTHDADITGTLPDPAPRTSASPSAYLALRITAGADIPFLPTQLVGDYNLPNVLAAVAVGKHFGVPDNAIKTAIENYTPSNSRSQLITNDDNNIILDAYNANPSSMRAAIENFAAKPGARVLILGAMAELGPESLNEHRAIVDLIGQHPWQDVVLVGGDFQKIDHPYHRFDNSREAGEWLRHAGLKDSYILIKGSRSMKMEEVLQPA